MIKNRKSNYQIISNEKLNKIKCHLYQHSLDEKVILYKGFEHNLKYFITLLFHKNLNIVVRLFSCLGDVIIRDLAVIHIYHD